MDNDQLVSYAEIRWADFFTLLKNQVVISQAGNHATVREGFRQIARNRVIDRDGNLWSMRASWSPLNQDFSVEARLISRVVS